MKTPGYSEADAKRMSTRKLIKIGWHDVARIIEACEKPTRLLGNDMIEVVLLIADGEGGERTIKDWLTGNKLGAAKLRHACEAVGAIAEYEAQEVTPEMFAGKTVAVKVGVRKQRGFPDQNTIEDYRAADSRVVNLRAAG